MRLVHFTIIYLFSHTLNAQTIVWEDSLTDAKIYFKIASEDFEFHKHRTSPAFEIIESDEKYHDAIIKTFLKALRKYPNHLLNEHVGTIYVYDQFYKDHGALGTYIGRHGFFFEVNYIGANIDSHGLERVIHHEISHRLQMFNPKLFDNKAWKRNNLMKYGAPYGSKLKIQEFDSALFVKGFLQSYGLTNKFEDFSTFAENIFIYNPVFWEAIQTLEKIRNKFELTCNFYEKLDPRLNKQYFLDLHNITLSNSTNE